MAPNRSKKNAWLVVQITYSDTMSPEVEVFFFTDDAQAAQNAFYSREVKINELRQKNIHCLAHDDPERGEIQLSYEWEGSVFTIVWQFRSVNRYWTPLAEKRIDDVSAEILTTVHSKYNAYHKQRVAAIVKMLAEGIDAVQLWQQGLVTETEMNDALQNNE